MSYIPIDFLPQKNRIVMDKLITDSFKRDLVNHGFTLISETDELYTFERLDFPNQLKTAQLLHSLPIDVRYHGSHNNNEIQSIGRFRLPQSEAHERPDFFVLPFYNDSNHQVLFANIPCRVLMDKISSEQISHLNLINSDIIFWLMPDHCLYECTRKSPEFEWFFLSKGGSKRMADGTIFDYSSYVDNWFFILE
jgi:hypothetical protein